MKLELITTPFNAIQFKMWQRIKQLKAEKKQLEKEKQELIFKYETFIRGL